MLNPDSPLFFDLALFAVAFFCFLVSLIILFSSRSLVTPANRLLAFYLFAMGLAMLMFYLILTGYILKVPWLFRLPSPLYYAMFPTVYLYVRFVLLDETRLRKTDYLHFLPAFVHLIEMLPYHFRTLESKISHVQEAIHVPLGSVSHDEGWLPPHVHNLIRGIMGIIYAGLMIRLLIRSRVKRPLTQVLYPEMHRWAWVLSIMLMVFSLSLSLAMAVPTLFTAPARAHLLFTMLAGTQIISGLYLMLNQRIIYGMPGIEKSKRKSDLKLISLNPMERIEEQDEPLAELNAAPITTEKQWQRGLEDKLMALMKQGQPFLKTRYSLDECAADLNVPRHHLSYLLNHVLNTRYNDFMNQCRLDYLQERLKKGDLKQMTFEGLALEAGFNSRITFIRAVKKLTGKRPTEYFMVSDLGEQEEF